MSKQPRVPDLKFWDELVVLHQRLLEVLEQESLLLLASNMVAAKTQVVLKQRIRQGIDNVYAQVGGLPLPADMIIGEKCRDSYMQLRVLLTKVQQRLVRNRIQLVELRRGLDAKRVRLSHGALAVGGYRTQNTAPASHYFNRTR